MTRAKNILKQWKQSDRAWLDAIPMGFRARSIATFLALAESTDIVSSGRAMWNLGMWLDDAWVYFDRPTRARMLKAVEGIMLQAKHDRASGLWKLGDFLGGHLATKAARRVLEAVASEATYDAAVHSALHGLAHYADERPKERGSVCQFLHRLTRRANRTKFSENIKNAILGIAEGSPCGAGVPNKRLQRIANKSGSR